MSKENVNAFSEKVNSNPELLEEVRSIGGNLGEIVALGLREGFDFSEQDLTAYVSEMDNRQGELTDQELEQVAGGLGAGSGFYNKETGKPIWPCT